MKKIFLISLAFLSGGCSNFLDEIDKDKLIPENVGHYSAVLLEEFSRKFPIESSVDFMTDNIVENPNVAEERRSSFKTVYTWKAEIELDENNEGVAVNRAWGECYEDIAIANYVLELIDDGQGSVQEKQFVKGEAHFVRAYCYFNLVNLYSVPYNQETASKDLGVPLRTGTTVEQVYHRASVKKCYEQIEKDLLEAKRLIKESGMVKSKWHPSETVCDLLLSRVYLYTCRWQLAIDYASEVMKRKQLSRVVSQSPLITEDKEEVIYTACKLPYFDLVIFEKGWQVTPELVSLYLAGDARKESFFKYSTTWRTYISVKQEHSFTKMGTYSMRVSEAYLNRAEAYSMLGQHQSARTDMVNLLNYRFLNASKVEQIVPTTNLLEFTLTERRKELCFEEHHRWFDLRRMKVRPYIKHEYTQTDIEGGNSGTSTYTLPPNDLNYTLPIPLEEREKNPLIKNNERRDKLPI
ncbi:MAG: RagB/SusD family nutrient uptake outer membrane protein [Odoribacter sp.]